MSPRIHGYHTMIVRTDDPTNLKASLRYIRLQPRFPEGDPDHDPTPLYHVSVILEEENDDDD